MNPVPGPLRLGCIMLTGGDRIDVAPDAVRSVAGFVDGMVFIRTDQSSDATILRCIDVCKERHIDYHVFVYPHSEFDCATARNYGLECAASLPYTWAMHIDTDERFETNGFDVRQFLLTTHARIGIVWCKGYHYAKERFIALPAAAKYVGRVHEGYADTVSPREIVTQPTFWEIEKPKDVCDAAMKSVEKKCRAWIADEPLEVRPKLYLANTLLYFRETEEAAELYEEVARMTTVDEEYGWAMFRAASCYSDMAQRDAALDACSRGLARCPEFPELEWIKGYQYLIKADPWRALVCANKAIAIGTTTSITNHLPPRSAFRFQPAFTWAPWEVREKSLRLMGDNTEADKAAKMFAMLKGRET